LRKKYYGSKKEGTQESKKGKEKGKEIISFSHFKKYPAQVGYFLFLC